MRKFVVEGTHLAIGNMIGEEFREEMNILLDIFRTRVVTSFFKNMDFEEAFQELNRSTNLFNNLLKNAPGLFEEIKGMAEAANINFRELFMLNCLDEVMSYSNQRRIAEKCTCISIKRKDNNDVFVAQNLDLSTYLNKYQVVLHLKHDDNDTEQLIFASPGYLGYTGVNNKSVAVVPNALTTLRFNAEGMPVSIIVRTILEKQNAKEAADYVMKTAHGAGQNYTIGDSGSIYSLECSGYKKEQLEVCENEYFDYTVHTNHPLKNDDVSLSSEENMPVSSYESTIQRQKTAEKFLKEADYYYTEGDLKSILTSHEHEPNCICRHENNNVMTIGSVVYKLTGNIEMNFAKGPGCINEYEKYTFE